MCDIKYNMCSLFLHSPDQDASRVAYETNQNEQADNNIKEQQAQITQPPTKHTDTHTRSLPGGWTFLDNYPKVGTSLDFIIE